MAMLIVAIVVFLAGVVLSLAMPHWEKSARQTRAHQTVEQLRTFARAFQSYAKQHHEWPPATALAGEVPAGMEGMLDSGWSRRTPIGGRYMWAPNALHRGQRYRATILIRPFAGSLVANDRELMDAIDRDLDDGDLRSGSFQIGYRNLAFFSLEP
jgi:type II secretory pathway pseudopilin PulG